MVLTAQIVFATACTLTKLSMLMFVRRMLSTSSLLWRRITWLAIIVVSVQGSVFILTVIFQCRWVSICFQLLTSCLWLATQTTTRLLEGLLRATAKLYTRISFPARCRYNQHHDRLHRCSITDPHRLDSPTAYSPSTNRNPTIWLWFHLMYRRSCAYLLHLPSLADLRSSMGCLPGMGH